jgi:hypothetical protein
VYGLTLSAEGLHDGTRPQVASRSFEEPGVQYTEHRTWSRANSAPALTPADARAAHARLDLCSRAGYPAPMNSGAPGPVGRPSSIHTMSSSIHTTRNATVYGNIVAITVPMPAFGW